MRITEEAREQGSLLSQEDLSKILMCDTRTIRRDIKALNELGITIATRGQQKDIGPEVTHRAVVVRLWLEGQEPINICRRIKHSIGAIENYLEKFINDYGQEGKKWYLIKTTGQINTPDRRPYF